MHGMEYRICICSLLKVKRMRKKQTAFNSVCQFRGKLTLLYIKKIIFIVGYKTIK